MAALQRSLQRAVTASSRGDYATAERLCRNILAAQPEHFDTLNLLGFVAARMGRVAEAAELLGRAAAVNPADFAVQNNRGLTLQALGRLDESLACYEQAIRLDPGNAAAHSNRGYVLCLLKRSDEALESCERAISLDPNFVEAHNNHGMALQALTRPTEALASYDRAIALKPGDLPPRLNRASTLEQLGRLHEALEALLDTCELTEWAHRGALGQLSRVVDGLDFARRGRELTQRSEECRRWVAEPKAGTIIANPLISVIVPSFNHRQYVEEALRSVFAQTYRNLELIVIDDGSQDGSPAVIDGCMRDCPFPHTFMARENRGAVATVRDALSLATGQFFNVLHSDDVFSADRISVLVREVAAKGNRWCFSAVRFIDAAGTELDPKDNAYVAGLALGLEGAAKELSTGMALLKFNVSITTGNLFVSRSFYDEVGGFRPYRYNEDWDFCIRASRYSEPAFVPEPLLSYRVHGGNTILGDREAAAKEALSMFMDYFREALDDRKWSNPHAPSYANWGDTFLSRLGYQGIALRTFAPDRFGAMLRRLRSVVQDPGVGNAPRAAR
ncbi:MAG TPA: tetratricopeptide repeat protein [Casimicrobiaceae bacterium]|nr:tetratricopeptide repeat protein [Casimicrobiaceae bacterium]